MKSTAAALIAAMAMAGCSSGRPQPAPEPAPVAVVTAPAATCDMQTRFEAGGIVRAAATTVVASRVMAAVTAVHVRAGERVRRGSKLVTLDGREVDSNSSRAAAAALSAAESVRAAEADVRSAESAVVLARATNERIQALFTKRSSTAQEADQAVAALRSAEAQVEAARARLSAAAAARDAARAGADAARINTTYSVLVAPFDAVVAERRVDPGTLATPGMPLLTLEDPSTFRLETPIDESRAAFVSVGGPVEVRIGETSPVTAADTWLRARVSEISRPDPASRTVLVKVDLPAGAVTRSGVFGRARFAAGARRALAVPRAAIVERGQLTFVYSVDRGERARLRAVSLGAEDDGQREVLAGLRESDAVIVNPPAWLTDGARVTGAAK